MDRREFLAISGVGLAALSAGCFGLDSDSDDEQRSYVLSVSNLALEPHSFRIRIGNFGEQWFQEESLELAAETGSDEIAVDETPARLFVTIDSNDEREFPWPASMDELGEAARKADVLYEPARTQDLVIRGDS